MKKEVEEQDYMVYNFKWKEIKGEWQTLEVIANDELETNKEGDAST